MGADKREILERVARGDLAPEDAEALLELASDDDEVPSAGRSGRPASEQRTAIRRVRVDAGFGAIQVVGDPDVAEAEIVGIHRASVEGDTLIVSGDSDAVAPGVFAIDIGGGRRGRRVRLNRRLAHGMGAGHSALRLRVNPSLELDVRLDAGPLAITGMHGPIRARSSAGPITIDGVVAPVDAAANAGAIRIVGRFDSGESRVRSDAGAIRIELEAGSDVKIAATAALGKVVLPGRAEGRGGFGSTREAIIGDGTATLRVETAMGSIQVLER